MAVSYNFPNRRELPDRFLTLALFLIGAVGIVAALFVVFEGEFDRHYENLYLLPWILGLGVILTIPSAILYYKGGFKLHDPLVFATWSYFFPAFVIGGFILTFGFSEPYFLSFVEDPAYNLPYSIALIALGYIGLAAGYFLPLGRRIGETVTDLLPERVYIPTSLVVPGFLLLSSGIAVSIAAFFLGLFGYQKVVEVGAFDGLIYLTTLYWLEGTFLLWCVVFSTRRIRPSGIAIGSILLAAFVGKALFVGNRGTLLQLFMTVVLAYTLSGRKLDFRRSAWVGLFLFISLMGGMIYGTTFREIKGGEEQVSADRYVESISNTLEHVSRGGNIDTLQFGLEHLAGRIEAVSSVGVVVSRHEQLAPYEESYGLNDNIWKDTVTFFVPRVLWKDKPVASDARRYSELYFEYGESSFTVTPIGDLLRNFGVLGIFLGMLVLGILLRTIYRTLIEGQPFVIWRGTLYFMLLTVISYEGFYGTILPNIVKIGIISVIGVLFVNFFARRARDISSKDVGFTHARQGLASRGRA